MELLGDYLPLLADAAVTGGRPDRTLPATGSGRRLNLSDACSCAVTGPGPPFTCQHRRAEGVSDAVSARHNARAAPSRPLAVSAMQS